MPGIPFGNEQQYMEKHPIVSSGSYLNTKNSKIHQLKSQTNLQSKDNESTRLSQEIASSWVSTEVDYTVSIDDKPTKPEFDNMKKLQRRRYWKNRRTF